MHLSLPNLTTVTLSCILFLLLLLTGYSACKTLLLALLSRQCAMITMSHLRYKNSTGSLSLSASLSKLQLLLLKLSPIKYLFTLLNCSMFTPLLDRSDLAIKTYSLFLTSSLLSVAALLHMLHLLSGTLYRLISVLPLLYRFFCPN